MSGCSLCEAPGTRRPVTASCCDAQACRLCAVQYLGRTGRCWAVDCGTPTSVSDLVLTLPELPSPLHCQLCAVPCRRAVSSPCCRALACRPCAVKYLAATRSCWGEACTRTTLRWEELETNTEVREQIQQQGLGPGAKEEDGKATVTPAAALPQPCPSLPLSKLLAPAPPAPLDDTDAEQTNGGQKREGPTGLDTLGRKRSKFDQICRTVGRAQLLPGGQCNSLLVRLTLQPDPPVDPAAGPRTVKVTLSKHFLKWMREQGCTIAAQVHRRRVLSCQASTFAFIQVVFTREPNQMILLESGFHIANFSVVPDRVAAAVRSAPTLLHTGAEAEVGTEATMIRLRVAGWEVEVAGESVFMVTGCSEDGKLELLTDFVLLDLGATKTVEVAVRAVGAEAVKLPADRVVAVALACDTDTAVPRVLAKLGQQAAAEPEDAGERWAGLSAEEKSRLAEERKLEGNTLFLGHKFEAALEKYTEAIELNPADATFFSNRAACHLNLGRPELGLADARHATKLDPQYAKGWLRGLRGSIQLGDMEQAKQMADRVLGLSAELRPLVEEEVAVMVKVETLQAELEEAMGKEHYSQALHCLDQLATCCPQGHMVAVARAEILAQKGSLFRVNEVLVQAFGTAQDRMEVYYIKGLVNYYQDKLDDAFQDLSRVLEVEPGHKKARSVLSRAIQYKVIKDKGKVLYMAEDFEAACQVYTDALTIDKLNTLANAKLYYNRAVNRAKLNKLSETVDDLTTAVQLDKGYTKAYLRRAQCFMELESYDEAVKDFERVVLLEPKNNEYGKMLSEASQKLRSSKNKDFYALLGVEKTASLITIKKAYRKAAMTHHPDRHSGTEEAMRTFHEKKFKDIGEAYSVLSDEDKRRKYDQGTLYNTIQAQAHAQHVAQAAQAYVAQAQAQAALLARLTLQAQQRQQGLGGIQPGLGLGLGGVGLMGVGPGGRPGGISPAWLSGVPGVAQRLPFPFAGPVGRGGGPLGGLLGGLPGAGGLLGAPQLNPRFPGFRFQ